MKARPVQWSQWYRALAIWAIVGALVEILVQLIFLWLLFRDEQAAKDAGQA